MYDRILTSVRISGGIASEFPNIKGLHQGLLLSLYLVALVMDELARPIQDEIPWCLLYADNIVLVDETRRKVSIKLKTRGMLRIYRL